MSTITEQQFSQFIISIKSNAYEQVQQYLAQYGSEITNKLQSQLRQPPLYFAINLPDDDSCLQVVKKLVENGANAHFKDSNEQTVMFYACRDGKAQCVDFLEKLGVSLYEQDAYGQTPLYYIANQNQVTLLHKYDKPEYYNHSDKIAKQTPLYYAAKKGYVQMCKALVDHGCDPTHVDAHNKTALEYARKARYHDVTEYLAAQVKRVKQSKMPPAKENPKAAEAGKKVQPKKQMDMESVSAMPKSFYKIVYVNDQGETKQMTQQDVRNLVKSKPSIQGMLANPSSIPKEQLQMAREQEEKQKWQKIANKILNVCWKAKGSHWFQQPVDPAKFGIMDYNDIISNPMDLGTIKKKLNYNFYPTPLHFAKDMRLVWQNCYRYNGDEHEISTCAKEIEKLFEEQYAGELKPIENSQI